MAGTNRDGSRQWIVDGELLSDEEFDALIARQALHAEAEALIDREIGEPLIGLDVQMAAEEDLRARGIQPDTATDRQLAAALARVSR